MKIRFYHWWIYKLYFYFWTPIFQQNKLMVKEMHRHMSDYLEKHNENK